MFFMRYKCDLAFIIEKIYRVTQNNYFLIKILDFQNIISYRFSNKSVLQIFTIFTSDDKLNVGQKSSVIRSSRFFKSTKELKINKNQYI